MSIQDMFFPPCSSKNPMHAFASPFIKNWLYLPHRLQYMMPCLWKRWCDLSDCCLAMLMVRLEGVAWCGRMGGVILLFLSGGCKVMDVWVSEASSSPRKRSGRVHGGVRRHGPSHCGQKGCSGGGAVWLAELDAAEGESSSSWWRRSMTWPGSRCVL